MIDGGKCCDDIMIQISANRSTINKVGGMILDTYIKDCLISSMENEGNEDKLYDLIDTIDKYVK